MTHTIRLFATLKEFAGTSQVSLDLKDPCTVTDLISELFLQIPALIPFEQNIIVSVNQEFADRSQQISSGDEIALFPPVSGG